MNAMFPPSFGTGAICHSSISLPVIRERKACHEKSRLIPEWDEGHRTKFHRVPKDIFFKRLFRTGTSRRNVVLHLFDLQIHLLAPPLDAGPAQTFLSRRLAGGSWATDPIKAITWWLDHQWLSINRHLWLVFVQVVVVYVFASIQTNRTEKKHHIAKDLNSLRPLYTIM